MAVNITRNSNIAHVKIPAGVSFFYKWLEFIKPLHGLTRLEMKVLAMFLAKRQELLEVISKESIVGEILMGPATRKEMRESMEMKQAQFNMILSNLKKVGAISDGMITPRYVPNVEAKSGEYKLILIFNILDENKEKSIQQG